MKNFYERLEQIIFEADISDKEASRLRREFINLFHIYIKDKIEEMEKRKRDTTPIQVGHPSLQNIGFNEGLDTAINIWKGEK